MDFRWDHELGDVAIEGGDFVLEDGTDAVRQKCLFRLSMVRGEWELDERQGFPWFAVWANKDIGAAAVRALIIRTLKSIPEVLEVDKVEATLDSQARSLSVTWSAQTTAGPVDGAREFVL